MLTSVAEAREVLETSFGLPLPAGIDERLAELLPPGEPSV